MGKVTMHVLIIGVLVPLTFAGFLWYRIYEDRFLAEPEVCVRSDEDGKCITQESDTPRTIVRESIHTIADMSIPWSPLYAGGFEYDTQEYVSGTRSLRVQTNDSEDWYGAAYHFEPEDWSDSDLRLFVRTNDWSALRVALLIVETGSPEEDSYFTFNFRNFLSSPASNEWIELVIPRSAFEESSGQPDWSKVRSVGLRVASNDDTNATLWIDDIARFKSAKTGVVSLTFDDSYADTLIGAELMAQYGWSGTNYVIPSHLGGAGFLTEADLVTLHEMGWDTSGHGYLDLREIGYEAAAQELASFKQYLEDRGFRGTHLYSYPNGSYDHEFQNLVQQYFMASRTIDGFMQPQGYVNLTKLNGMTVSNTTPVEDIFAWIDKAEEEGSWLILTWHKLPEGEPLDDIEYARADFVRVLEYLSQKSIEVAPVSVILDRLLEH